MSGSINSTCLFKFTILPTCMKVLIFSKKKRLERVHTRSKIGDTDILKKVGICFNGGYDHCKNHKQKRNCKLHGYGFMSIREKAER